MSLHKELLELFSARGFDIKVEAPGHINFYLADNSHYIFMYSTVNDKVTGRLLNKKFKNREYLWENVSAAKIIDDMFPTIKAQGTI